MFNETDSEVDRRFDMAYCYRLLLKQSFFEDDTSASEIVESEIRAFIRQRLEVLMGVTADLNEVAGSKFTHEEIVALKALAGKVLGQTQAPEKKKTTTKFTESNTIEKERRPKRRNTAVVTANDPESFRGAVKAESPSGSKPNSYPQSESVAPSSAPKGELATDHKNYYEGQIIEENGQKFKIKIQEIEGNKYVLKQNITGQVGSPNRIAMPTSFQLEQISRQQAIDSLQNLDPLAATAVQLTQTE